MIWRWSFLLMLLVLSTCWLREGTSTSKVLNKDSDSLVKKPERKEVKPELHNSKYIATLDVNPVRRVYSVDEQDAILFEYVLLKGLFGVQRSIRLLSTLIRISGDTLAGVLSGVVKVAGGLLGVVANVFWFASSKLAVPTFSSQLLGNLSVNCAYGLRSSASMLYGLSEACIWSGEILESVTLGLGEAVQDTFWGLEALSNSSDVVVKFLLQLDNSTEGEGGGTSRLWTGNDSSSNSDSTISAGGDKNYSSADKAEGTDSASTKHGKVRTKDILHPTKRHDIEERRGSGTEVNLGKQWVPPLDFLGASATAAAAADQKENQEESTTASGGASRPRRAAAGNHHGTEGANSEEGDWRAWVRDALGLALSAVHYVLFELPGDLNRQTEAATDSINLQAAALAVWLNDAFCAAADRARSLTWTVLWRTAAAISVSQMLMTDEGASQGVFFLLALFSTFLLSLLPFRSWKSKCLTVLCFALVLYASFTATEEVQRGRIAARASVEAAHNLLQQQAAQRSRRAQRDHAGVLLDEESYIDVDELPSVPTGADLSSKGSNTDARQQTTGRGVLEDAAPASEEALFAFDDAIWLNTALSAMWEVLDPRFQTGGVGPYISDMYADMVNAELAKVPPGVANVRLKRFELGHSAPLFKGVRVIRARNHTCLRASLQSELQHPHAHDGSESSSSNNNASLAAQQQGFLAQLVDLMRAGQTALPSLLTKATQAHSQQQQQSGHQSPTSTPSATAPGTTRPTKRTAAHQPVPGRARRMPFLEQFSAECDRLVLEMDCVYASRDMGVVLSLRSSDLQTLVPEVSVTLSEVHLSGQLRLNVSLTPDYPFIGTGQLSFMSAPQLAFSISSFGGLELSSMPYAYQWVNSSMHWLLEQYTAPQYTLLDLRHTICPSCDRAVVPLSQSLREAVRDTLEHARVGLRRLTERAKVAAAHTRRFAVKLQRGYQKLSALGREHSRKLGALYNTVSAHSSVLGSQLGAALRDAKRRMRAQMRGVPPLPALGPSVPGNGAADGADSAESAEELHFAWYKGFDDVTEDLLAGRVPPSPGHSPVQAAAAPGRIAQRTQDSEQQQEQGQLLAREVEDAGAPVPDGIVEQQRGASGSAIEDDPQPASSVSADNEGDAVDERAEPVSEESDESPAYGWSAMPL